MLVPFKFPFIGHLGKTVAQNSQTSHIFSKQTRAKLSIPKYLEGRDKGPYQVVEFRTIVSPAKSTSLCFCGMC